MKRDVSFSLLGLIMLLCLGIAAASVYYQYTYTDLQSKYEVSNDTLQKTMIDYQEKEMFLDAALQNLSLSEEREEALGGKYQKVETEKVGLQTDLATANEAIKDLNRQNEDLQSSVDALERENGKLVFEKDQLKEEKRDLNNKIDNLNNKIDNLDNKIDDLNAQIAALEATQSE
ncbi:MAG: Chromosome partition protein Smc [Candidatus Methanogasteraceae archaeon]|nr:MAG: Chromosome partition protein Smc [ANME-2 cluster archaeon]